MRAQNKTNQTAQGAGKRERPRRDTVLVLHLIGYEIGTSFLAQ